MTALYVEKNEDGQYRIVAQESDAPLSGMMMHEGKRYVLRYADGEIGLYLREGQQ